LIELDPNEASAKGRPLALHLAAGSLRVLEDYRAVIGTVDAIGVVAAVAAGSAADPDAPDAMSRGCTIAAIAALCRADKETTRRRVLRLVEGGVLHRNADGRVLLNDPFFRQPAVIDVMRRHAATAARLANTFAERGVLGQGGTHGEVRLEPCPAWSGTAAADIAGAMLASVHRSLDAYRKVVGSADYVLVVLAVLVISARHLMAKAELPEELEDVRTAIPRDRLAPCNISSIAAAAGLPFETARRKTLELVARGALVRDDAGNVQFTPGVLQQPMIYDLVAQNAARAVALANRLLQLGILVAQPAPR
jgi:DNA-binding IclR family transcriptional regulator